LVKAIERLIELDEQESAKQKVRAEFLTLIAAVIDALPDGLIVTDVEGKIILLNEKVEFMFGYHRTELIGEPVERLLPQRLRAAHIAHRDLYNRFELLPHARTMGVGLQLQAIGSDNREFPVDITLARMVVPKGVYNLALIRSGAMEAAAFGSGHGPEQENQEHDAGQ